MGDLVGRVRELLAVCGEDSREARFIERACVALIVTALRRRAGLQAPALPRRPSGLARALSRRGQLIDLEERRAARQRET